MGNNILCYALFIVYYDPMSERIQKVFNIHPGERGMVALVLAYAIMLYFSNMMARTASMALFFGEYDAATLPYTYLFLMVVGPLVSFVYLRLNNNFALSKVLVAIHVFLLLSLILLPLLLGRLSTPYLLFSLPIYFGVNNSLTISSFWNLLGRIYNLRQGKRLFGLLSSGEHMATIVSGFMAPLFVAQLGTINLYWIGALFMVGAAALLLIINRKNAAKMESAVGGERERGRGTGFLELAKDPYVRLIFSLFTLFIIGVYMVGNISYAQAEIRFPTADEMATFIGIFMGVFGVLSLFVQWVLAGRLMDRFGVRSMILATPGGLFILMSLFALVGTLTDWTSALFWLATSASMYQAILDAADSAAINVLYQPLPVQQRTQAQTTVIGVVYPLAIGLAGILLIFLLDVLGFNSVQLSYATLIVIVLWLIIGLRMGRAYPGRLHQALRERSLSGLSGLRPDQDSIPILEEALHSAHPNVVLYALDMLQEVTPDKMAQHLPGLLDYPDEAVQIAALERISALTWQETPRGILTLLETNDNARVRAAALRTWVAIDKDAAPGRLEAYSNDAHQEVQEAALVIMRQHPDTAVREQALTRLHEMAAAGDAGERIAAACVLGRAANPADAALLIPLLGDKDTAVRQAALEAAAGMRAPQTWPAVILALARSETRNLAISALAAAGEEVLPLLEEMQRAAGGDPALLAGITAVYGRIGGPQATANLQALTTSIDTGVRHQALLALSQNKFQADTQDRPALEAQMALERQRLLETLAGLLDLGDEQPVRLAAGALEEKQRLLADNLLLLLSFLYDPEGILSAREALLPSRETDEEKSAYAIEVLDISLSQAHKGLLLPFFQDQSPAEQQALIQKEKEPLLGRKARLLALLQPGPGELERWTRICAIYALGELGGAQAGEAIVETAVRESADCLLLETALNSLQAGGADLQKIAAAHPALQEAVASLPAGVKAEMSVLQKTEFLKNVSIFSHLPESVLFDIAGLVVEESVPVGKLIIRKGDQGDTLFVIVEGRLRVHDGERTIDSMSRGGVVGEMALLDSEPRSASVTAEEKSRLLRLDQEPFYALLAAQPDLARDLMGLLSRRLRERTAELPAAEEKAAALPVLPLVGAQPGMTSTVAVQGNLMDLDKVFVLKRFDLFGTSDNLLLGQVASLLEEVDLAGGEVLFQQGDPGHSLYLVAAGQLRVHIGERTLAYVGEGEVIGEMALLESQPRLATVTGSVPSQLLRLEQAPFFELLASQPQLARGLISLLSGRLRERLESVS
jgi:AAA family ATP:ADP antiporter